MSSSFDRYVPVIEDIDSFRHDPNLNPTLYIKVSDLIPNSSPVFNVKSYGAVGDGITDDSVAIQTAINAAQGSGGTVILPATVSNYLIGSPLLIRNNRKAITLRGDGLQVTNLKAKSGLNDYLIKFTLVNTNSMTGFVFEDFGIDGNFSGQSSGGCIYALGAVQCQFNRLHLYQAYDNALYLFHDGNNGTGHHNRVINSLFDNSQGSAGDGRALKMEASDENFIFGNDFESNGRSAASEPNHIYDRSGLQIIVQNTFVGGQTGVKCEGSHSIVADNIFDGTNNHCVRLNGNDHIVRGNQFKSIGNGTSNIDGVWIDNVTRNVITGNNFEAASTGTRSGVNIANSSTNTLVVSNLFSTNQGAFGSAAVVVTGSGHVIKSNLGFADQ